MEKSFQKGNVRKAMCGKYIFLFVLLLLLVAVPLVFKGYIVRLLTKILMYAILAASVNIISGFTGYPALGNVVFFGTGAYMMAILLTNTQMHFLVDVLLSGLACVVYSLIIGIFVLRLRGRYFLMATVALLSATKQIVSNLKITNGGKGITMAFMKGAAEVTNRNFYLLMLALLAGIVVISMLLDRNRSGYAMKSINYDEDAALVMGVNTTLYKNLAWSISALFTGMTGAVYAYWATFIEPASVFDMAISTEMYLMYVFGGAGTVLGPILGAVVIELLSELAWSNFMEWHYMILGLLMIACVLFFPKGLMSVLNNLQQKCKQKFAGAAGKDKTAEDSPAHGGVAK